MNDDEKIAELGRIHNKIHRRIIRATASLFHLLRENQGVIGCYPVPVLSSLKAYPFVPPMDLYEIFRPEGEVQQIAFKGWICEVFNTVWEHERKQLKKALGGDSQSISPQMDCMGDLRHIRNDLIHKGQATSGETGKCTILKWFKVGDPIILNLEHVLDFLHQMNSMVFVRRSCIDVPGWKLRENMDVECGPPPRLISTRESTDQDGEGGSTRHMLSVVFSDGISGCFADPGAQLSEEEMYYACIRHLVADAPSKEKGMFGPPIRFGDKK